MGRKRYHRRSVDGSGPKLGFGGVAFKKGFITVRQLAAAKNRQVQEDMENKPHRLMGEIFIELGYMDRAQVDEVLEEMRHD